MLSSLLRLKYISHITATWRYLYTTPITHSKQSHYDDDSFDKPGIVWPCNEGPFCVSIKWSADLMPMSPRAVVLTIRRCCVRYHCLVSLHVKKTTRIVVLFRFRLHGKLISHVAGLYSWICLHHRIIRGTVPSIDTYNVDAWKWVSFAHI